MTNPQQYDKTFHFNNAKALIEAGGTQSLRYACLEMRMLIEAHVYQRLLREADELPRSIINTWQPYKAVRLHCEFDKYADMDMRLEITDPEGNKLDDINYHNLKKGDLTKIYNSLGGYLHLPMPEKIDSYVIDADTVRVMLDKLERIIKGNLIIYKVNYESIECKGCGKGIIFTKHYLDTHDSISCQNSDCALEYSIQKDKQPFELSLEYRGFACHVCKNEIPIPLNKIADGYAFQCSTCLTNFKFELQIRTETPFPD
ncbi:hypothetical protein BK674_15850 [Pseudomonas moraviensis]|uniref:Uncharacterized protein n=1 Tax=Pseudomonas moraviensis TaxID=321662 RepID=A0A423NL69_9PSED|nr:hypothetical protein [Pseudomonas moraviensis]RON98921.1 hypothetical protein BK674_15850 [Pseudomonas moraviensis]